MQLDRTADLLLDVEWYAKFGDNYFIATLQLILEKTPFSRWRTLKVHISGESQEDVSWSSAEALMNLESLSVLDRTDTAFLSVIDRMMTSRLNVLDLCTPRADFMTTFAKSFANISYLALKAPQFPVDIPFLPENVVILQHDYGRRHLFPHIHTYRLVEGLFYGGNNVDLRNMTILTVRQTLIIICRVFLPALRELTLGSLWMPQDGEIEAPSLDILHFRDDNGKDDPLKTYHFRIRDTFCRQIPPSLPTGICRVQLSLHFWPSRAR